MLKRTLVFSSPMILSLKNQQLVYAFKLWFDVEKRYKTIFPYQPKHETSCGLM